jgi:hypothetical protein
MRIYVRRPSFALLTCALTVSACAEPETVDRVIHVELPSIACGATASTITRVAFDTARIEGLIRRVSGLTDSTHALVETDFGVYVSTIGSTVGSQLLGQWHKERGGFLSVSSAVIDTAGSIVIADYKSMRVSYFDRQRSLLRTVLLRPGRLVDSIALGSHTSAFVESAPGAAQYGGADGSLREVATSGRNGPMITHFPTVARRVADGDGDLVGVGRYAEFQPMLSRAHSGDWIVAAGDSFDVQFVSATSNDRVRFVGGALRPVFPKRERDSVVAASLAQFGKFAVEYRGYVDEHLVGRRDSFQLLRRIRYAGNRLYAERFRACENQSVWFVLDTLSRTVSTLTLPLDADIIESQGSMLYITWSDTAGTHLGSSSVTDLQKK